MLGDGALGLVSRWRAHAPMMLLMRHSVRERNLDRADHLDPISADGLVLARRLGALLPSRRCRLYASPIPRCRQTIVGIAAALRHTRTDCRTAGYLAPFYMRSDHVVRAEISARGLDRFLIGWMADRADPAGILPASAAWQRLRRGLRTHLARQPRATIDICITHDWNLCLVKRFALDDPGWAVVDLEGVAVWYEDELRAVGGGSAA